MNNLGITPGPWEMQTSCSYRRIGAGGKDGNVLCAVTQWSDGHPDLHWSNGGFEGPDATAMLAAPELLAACKAQHEAIDRLFALLVMKDSEFLPSKSGQPWEALVQGNAAIKEAEGR